MTNQLRMTKQLERMGKRGSVQVKGGREKRKLSKAGHAKEIFLPTSLSFGSCIGDDLGVTGDKLAWLDASLFKVSVLTPEMTQYAKERKLYQGGRLLGRGGVRFQAQGDNNHKRSFFEFEFDGEFSSDENEIDDIAKVTVIKHAVMTHNEKKYLGGNGCKLRRC